MSGLGHNNGPTMERGYGWRKHSWGRARAALLPTLPIEILRKRVARAKEIGLPYKTYASIRAASGHDVVAFLFSSNALRIMRPGQAVPAARAAKLCDIRGAKFAGLVQPPLLASELEETLRAQGLPGLAASGRAPRFDAAWSDQRDAVLRPVRAAQLPKDGVIVIGDTSAEQDWCAAGQLAGFVASDTFFAPQP